MHARCGGGPRRARRRGRRREHHPLYPRHRPRHDAPTSRDVVRVGGARDRGVRVPARRRRVLELDHGGRPGDAHDARLRPRRPPWRGRAELDRRGLHRHGGGGRDRMARRRRADRRHRVRGRRRPAGRGDDGSEDLPRSRLGDARLVRARQRRRRARGRRRGVRQPRAADVPDLLLRGSTPQSPCSSTPGGASCAVPRSVRAFACRDRRRDLLLLLRPRPARLHAPRLPGLLGEVRRPRRVAEALLLVTTREVEQGVE
jgi:hypothetical protein